MFRIWLSMIFLLANVNFIESLECYTCTDTEDLGNCQSTSQCPLDQICYQDSTTVGQSKVYKVGCIDKQQCGAHGSGAPGLVGRDISERQSDLCHECCSTDRCNKHLCDHLKPTACVDDATVDCGFLNTVINICQDIQHAKKICPKFCGLCTLVDGMWSNWAAWSMCTVTCKNGTQTRTRACTNPPPSNGGLNCSGNSRDVKGCHKQLCPVHGGWSRWSGWESCSVTCDSGVQKRHRNCSNPLPDRFGDHCFGDTVDVRLCTPGPCANGGWSGWGSWTTCSATCGGGLRSNSRTCTNPAPSPRGKFCNGNPMQIEQCNKKSCVPNVIFNAYYVTDLSPAAGQTMIFSEIVVNEGDAYNSSTGEFTAPVDGIYSFSAQLCFSNNQEMFFDIKVGGTTYASAYGYDDDAYPCKFIQTSARVRKGEKVIVQWTTLSYTSNYIGQATNFRNFFTGTLVHPQF